ncbi:MAG: hypothetical protein JWN39_107, partial [Ilumatobacteraceae bacterium]|nr:hypothetical protein [Ilumatobacteraceae bacterium]
ALDINAGEVDALRLEVGAALNFGFSPKVKVQPTASLQFECPFGRVSGLRVTAPGPLAAFMSLFVNGDQKSRLAATLAGGPKLEAGMECSLTISMVAGFSYERSSGTTDISKGDAKAGCKPVWDPSANVGDGTVGVQLDVTFGLPLVATAGVQLGGVVAESISRLLSWFNKGFERLGAVDAATAEITPQLHITVENDVNAIAFRGAKSGFTAESVGKVYLNVKPLSWILKRFGAKDGAFTLTLYQQTFPITSAYAALNSTRIESTIDGEDVAQSPAIYVQADDQLDIVSTLAPASKGVGFITFPITTAKLYEVQSGGVVEASDIFPVEVVASKGVEAAYGKTSIEVRTKITKAMCDQLRDEPKEFVLVGDAPFNLFVEVSAPAYGGRFEIQCVDGKIAFDPLTIDALDPNVPTTVHVISSGAKDDEAKITGRPDWLGIDPGIIPLTGNPAKDAKSDTEVELTVLDRSSHCVASRTAKLTVTTRKRGKSELTITEANPCYVRWALPQVTAPSGVGAVDVTADLLTKGRDDDFTNVEVDPDAADWLSVSPSGQLALPDTHDAQTTTTYTFTVQRRDRKCVTQLPRSATIHIHTATRGDTDLKIIDPKVEAYEDCGARFTPSRVADTGVSQLTVRDDQLADDTATWSMDDIGSLPDWLSVTPQSGNVSSASPVSVHFVVLPTPYDHCVGRPQVSWALSATVVVQSDNDHGPKTLPARVSVTRPAIAPDNCPRANGAAVGDPHMTSMDGISFEGQILGEYIYARSPAGAANPYQIVVRTQPTSGAVTVQAPTSVTALAITQSDHKVETYRAANGGHDVLIDGVLTTVVDGVPLVVSDTMSVTRTGIEIRFDMPGITVSLSNTGIYNLRIAASIGTPMEGLLGSPDGNAANDFVSPANVSYTVSQITTNQVPQFYDYVTSWRITDIAQSPFTRHYAQFGAANPGFSQQILDDFGPGVDAALGGQSRICSGALTTQQRYGLALELSIGSSVAQLGGYICSYSVAGTVTADGGLPSSGLRITVDGIGLRPCVTTSGLDGRYVCTMAVDLAEVNAVAGTGDVLPMTVSVSGTWPGVTAPAATGSTVFTTKAPLASGPTSNTVDLSIDPNSVPRLDVSGTVMGDGVPIAGPRFFSVAAFDAVGAMVQSTSENADVDVDSGHYSFSRLLPPTAVRAVVTTTLSSPENETYTIEATSLVGGRNAVTLNVASSPVHLHVTGTLIDENGASLSNVPLIVMFRSSTGVVLSSQGRDVTADPTTHRYDADFIGHSGATSADLTATVGAVNETFTASVSGLVDGTNPAQTFDVSTAPVRLALTGHVVDQDGHGLPATFRMDAFFFDSAGNLVTEIRNAQSVTPDDAASGHYATNFTGHRAAVRVLLRAYVGAVGEYVEQNITGLHHGANSATFEIQYGNPVVTISGKLTGPGNTKVSDQVPIRVIGTDAGDAEIYNHVQFPTLDPDGAYHVTVTMSTLVTKVSAIAQIGVSQSDWFHLDPVAVHAGANTIPFDVDYRPATVTVTGTILKSVGPPAVPIAPTYLPIPLGIGAYWPDDGGELGQFFYTQPNVVTLDSNGGYSFDVTLPLKTTSVEARLFITGRQDTVTMVAGFTPGTHRTITLNAVHNPPTITVHGVARIDGQLELHPSSIDVTVKSYAGATLNTQFTRTVSPNATTGVYSSALLLPNGTTRADVTVHPRNGSNTYPSAVENIVPGDQRDVTIDFDDGTTRIALSGNLMVFGVPTTRATLYATTTGGPNPQNSMTIGSVVVDQTTGHYATTFTVPNGTTHVSVSATLSTNSWSDIVLSHDVVPAIVGVGTTTDTWSADATLLRVTGTLTDGVQRVTGLPGDDPDNGDDATLVFGIDVSGPTSNYSTNESALYEGDNTFEFGVVVPSDSASVNLTVLGVVPSTDPDPALAVALTGHGSIIDQTWNVDVSHSAAVTNYVAAGVISNNPLDPADQRFRVDVIGVSYTDDSTPYVEVFHDSQTYPTLPGGGYGVGWALPANVNLVRSTVTVLDTNGDPLPGGAGWSVVTHISPADAGSTVQGTLNIDLGQTTYGYAGNVNLDGCSGPLLFRREFWVFNSPTGPTGPYVPASGPTPADWPGGTLVLNDEVLPDGRAPYHHSVRVNIPSDTTFVGTVYFDHNSQGTGINTTAFVSPANIDVTADETAVC